MDESAETVDAPAGDGSGTVGRREAAVAGCLAAAAALATAELVSGLTSSMPSLILAVADVVVDETPGGIVRWSIDTFGRHQKPILVTGIIVLALGLGAVFGLIARNRFWAGAAGFVAFGALGGLAASHGEESTNAAAWLSAMAATGIGLAVLWGLLVLAGSSRPAGAELDSRGDELLRSRRRFLL